MSLSAPRIEGEGIHFRVRIDYRFNSPNASTIRDCYISNDTLAMLAERRNVDGAPSETFNALEMVILGVARRLAQAGVPGSPLKLARSSFR